MHEAEHFGLDPAKTRVIRPAVDTEAFRPRADAGTPKRGALRVVMVGGLRWEKGHEYALEAIRRVVDADVAVELGSSGVHPPTRRWAAASRHESLTPSRTWGSKTR